MITRKSLYCRNNKEKSVKIQGFSGVQKPENTLDCTLWRTWVKELTKLCGLVYTCLVNESLQRITKNLVPGKICGAYYYILRKRCCNERVYTVGRV